MAAAGQGLAATTTTATTTIPTITIIIIMPTTVPTMSGTITEGGVYIQVSRHKDQGQDQDKGLVK